MADRELILEILLIDDGSDDETGGAARCAAGKCALPLTLLRAEVRNAGAARNIGLRHAKGDFVFFLDADDEVVSGGLRLLLDALAGAPHARLALGGAIRRTRGRADKLKLPHGYTEGRDANVRNYLANRLWPIAMGSALLSRDTAAAVRFPENLEIDEDTCYWAAVLAMTDVVMIERPVLYYNLDEMKMASRFVTQPRREFVRIAAAYRRLAADGLDHEILKWRKSWIALRMVRQLLIHKQFALAARVMRAVVAHPQFRSSFRVLRYSLRIRTGLIALRLRPSRSAASAAGGAFPA